MNVDTMDLMEDDAIEATDNDDDDDSPSSTGSNYEETPNLMDVRLIYLKLIILQNQSFKVFSVLNLGRNGK